MFHLITCLFVFLFVCFGGRRGNWHVFFLKTPSRFADAVFFWYFSNQKSSPLQSFVESGLVDCPFLISEAWNSSLIQAGIRFS